MLPLAKQLFHKTSYYFQFHSNWVNQMVWAKRFIGNYSFWKLITEVQSGLIQAMEHFTKYSVIDDSAQENCKPFFTVSNMVFIMSVRWASIADWMPLTTSSASMASLNPTSLRHRRTGGKLGKQSRPTLGAQRHSSKHDSSGGWFKGWSTATAALFQFVSCLFLIHSCQTLFIIPNHRCNPGCLWIEKYDPWLLVKGSKFSLGLA